MWSSADVVGLFSSSVVSFSSNMVLRGLLSSLNSISKPGMLSVGADYVQFATSSDGQKLIYDMPIVRLFATTPSLRGNEAP
jgi:hypothetical protein